MYYSGKNGGRSALFNRAIGAGMDDDEAFDFVYDYFNEVFNKRNVDALDLFLDDDYWDADIGSEKRDHVRSSKEYLAALFRNNPDVMIEVVKVMSRDNVITAFLEWYEATGRERRILKKGVGIFVIRGSKILKRSTHLYYDAERA
ncbi:MAG: nuclear transport factor 2 family protein [Bacillota bacterium]|nr:nuclear transport factor 2 family protein [Bacillota bacterium]